MSVKRASLLMLFVMACFGVGFWIAQHPDLYLRTLQIGDEEIRIYSDDDSLIDSNIQSYLISQTHLNLKFLNSQKESAQLWIVSFKSAKEFKAENVDFVSIPIPQISNDFNLSEIEQLKSHPLAWKVDNTSLSLKVLLIPKPNKRYKISPALHFLITTLYSPEFFLEIINKTPWNSIYALDIPKTPKERNALQIRKIDLRKLKIQ